MKVLWMKTVMILVDVAVEAVMNGGEETLCHVA
ncbi:hypothetical protein Tco_1300340, partial [Tanacetum coccineum]